MTWPDEPDEAKPRLLGDRGVAQRIAKEEHVAWRETDQGHPVRELVYFEVVWPPPVDRGREFGQAVVPAESVDKLSPGAAAQQDGHASTPEPGEGRVGVGEWSTALDEGFLFGFEPGGDLLGTGMTRGDGFELGSEVVTSGGEVAASRPIPCQAELGGE